MRIVSRKIIGTVTAVLVGLGGYSVSLAQPPPSPQVIPQEEAEPECPQVLRGARLTTESIDRGVAFSFTTPRKELVAELRTQLREVAKLLEEHSKELTSQVANDPHAVRIPPVDVAVRDVGSGVRITIRAEEEGDVGELRQHAQGFQQFWQASDCVTEPSAGTPAQLPGQRT